ncbi:MAG TPA: hypothetical protein VHY08_27490, partial [Bacillota bacterium]|nr:hypothetical protein [Bacillota bacterium]
PDYLPTYFNLGLVYYHWKRYQNALLKFQEAKTKGFDNPLVQYNLGLVNAAMGKSDQARQIWKALLTANGAGPLAAEIQKQLGSLK